MGLVCLECVQIIRRCSMKEYEIPFNVMLTEDDAHLVVKCYSSLLRIVEVGVGYVGRHRF